MTLNANVRLYGPTTSMGLAGVALERDAYAVDITATEWQDGVLRVYVDLDDPESGSSLDLWGSLDDFRALRDRLSLAIREAAAVPVEDRR